MKRTLAALLAVLMTLMLWVEPARAADQPLEVSLKTPIEKSPPGTFRSWSSA